MTPTNNQIYMAAITLLNNAALGYPISWPGFNFTPPSSGVWLEVSFFPNEGIDNGMAYSDTVVPRGIFQVACVNRPGAGLDAIHAAADQIRALYAKGVPLVGRVRVIREPWDMEIDTDDDRLMVVVSADYSG